MLRYLEIHTAEDEITAAGVRDCPEKDAKNRDILPFAHNP